MEKVIDGEKWILFTGKVTAKLAKGYAKLEKKEWTRSFIKADPEDILIDEDRKTYVRIGAKLNTKPIKRRTRMKKCRDNETACVENILYCCKTHLVLRDCDGHWLCR